MKYFKFSNKVFFSINIAIIIINAYIVSEFDRIMDTGFNKLYILLAFIAIICRILVNIMDGGKNVD